MALLLLALLQRIFLMSSLMLLLVWLIFFMVLIKLLPILGTISGKTVQLMVLALICRSEERRVGKAHPAGRRRPRGLVSGLRGVRSDLSLVRGAPPRHLLDLRAG